MRRAAAVLSLALLGACNPGGPANDLQRMREQPRADVYEASGFLPDSMVNQAPPAGTVAREAVTDRRLATGTADGAPLARVPLPLTPALLRVGGERFEIFCAACHGAAGWGGSVVATNMQPPRPPSLHSPRVQAMPAGMLYRQIARGGVRMPSYAAELSVPERWAVVAFVQRLAHTPPRTPAARRDSLTAARLRAPGSPDSALQALPRLPASNDTTP